MRQNLIIPMFLSLTLATGALATTQESPSNRQSTANQSTLQDAAREVSQTLTKYPAVATTGTVNPMAPIAGSNSFTQAQVRERLMAQGFRSLDKFHLAESGIWHVNATKNGKPYRVMFDYQGNIRATTLPNASR